MTSFDLVQLLAEDANSKRRVRASSSGISEGTVFWTIVDTDGDKHRLIIEETG